MTSALSGHPLAPTRPRTSPPRRYERGGEGRRADLVEGTSVGLQEAQETQAGARTVYGASKGLGGEGGRREGGGEEGVGVEGRGRRRGRGEATGDAGSPEGPRPDASLSTSPPVVPTRHRTGPTETRRKGRA